MKIYEKWNSISLIIRIVCGMIIGVILGLLIPNVTGIAILGDLFVGALKAIAPILVLVLVASSLANARGGHAHKFRTVILLYLLSTMAASALAVIVNFLFPTSVPVEGVTASDEFVAPSGMSEVITNLLKNIVANPVDAVLNANYIGILFWAVILGLALKHSSDGTKRFLDDLADAISKIVRWIISFAPFGILGLVFNSVSTSGIDIFVTYGHLVAVLVCTMLLVAFALNPLIIGLFLRHNPYPLIWKCIRTSGVTAFFTRSSAANIPVNMELCEELGLDEDMYSVSIPLGATINMSGAAVTITTFSLSAAYTMDIPVSIGMAIVLSFVGAFSACGASGVAGGSLLLIPLGCSLFGVAPDVAMAFVGVGFIIGVIQDSMETALNSSGDAIFTATAEFREWKKEGRALPL